jgi:hypothetical protein
LIRLLLRPADAANAQAISTGYLAELRRDGRLREGIHYRQIAPGRYRYYSDAIDHFFAHRTEPEEHERWIQQQLKETAAPSHGSPQRSA